MSRVRIEKRDEPTTHTLTRYLALALGLMTLAIIFVSHNNPSITGSTVFGKVYGGASSLVVLFLLIVVIYLYTRLK